MRDNIKLQGLTIDDKIDLILSLLVGIGKNADCKEGVISLSESVDGFINHRMGMHLSDLNLDNSLSADEEFCLNHLKVTEAIVKWLRDSDIDNKYEVTLQFDKYDWDNKSGLPHFYTFKSMYPNLVEGRNNNGFKINDWGHDSILVKNLTNSCINIITKDDIVTSLSVNKHKDWYYKGYLDKYIIRKLIATVEGREYLGD